MILGNFVLYLYCFSVQFWYCSNYHWFLKQELRFSHDSISDACWDSENSLKFHILTKTGGYLSYLFCWEIFQSHGHHVNNDSTVAMVDGGSRSLLYYNLIRPI